MPRALPRRPSGAPGGAGGHGRKRPGPRRDPGPCLIGRRAPCLSGVRARRHASWWRRGLASTRPRAPDLRL
eukprot:13108620-Alexandrium_andersonii.AAC.1